MRILGVDPGSQITGFGVIDFEGNRMSRVASGSIQLGRGDMNARLARIFRELSAICREQAPDAAAVESVFVKRNVSSAIKLGQARGAALCAIATQEIEIAEYSPASIKQTIAGGGRAQKEQLEFMVRRLLNLSQGLQEDEADALAIAICHAHHAGRRPATRRRA